MDDLSKDQDRARLAAQDALALPDVAQAVASGVPVLILASGPTRLVHANQQALQLFGVLDLATLNTRVASEPAFARFQQLNASLRPGAPPRIERLRVAGGATTEPVAFSIRRLAGALPLLIALAPDHASSVAAQAAPASAAPAIPAPTPSVVPAPPVLVATSVAKADTGRAATPATDNPFVRFLWQTDALNKIVSVTGQFSDIVGAGPEAFHGKTFGAVAKAAGADADGRLEAMLARRETWSNLELLWPITDTSMAVPVVLGGLPVFDADRTFEGFRGFGVIHLQRKTSYTPPAAATPATDQEARPIEHHDNQSDIPGEPAAEPSPMTDTIDLFSRPDQTPGEPGDQTNVVVLRPQRGTPEPSQNETVTPLPMRPRLATPDMSKLSASERNAFREIARALGAKLDEGSAPPFKASDMAREAQAPETPDETQDPHAPLVVPPGAQVRDLIEIASRVRSQSDSTVAGSDSTPTLPAEGPINTPTVHDDAQLLDHLPIGILIHTENGPAYANQTILEQLGFSSLDAFRSAGGLEHMFRGRSPEVLAGAAAGGAIPLVGRDGEVLAAETRLQAILWQGRPASLITVRLSRDADLTARLRDAEQSVRGRDAEIRELHSVLDTATDGVAVIDEEGRVLSLNRSAQALFGYDQMDVSGQFFTMLLARESQQVAMDYLTGLKASGVASVMNDGREVIGRARQGGTIPLFLTLGRITAGSGHKFCAVMRDMTSWKKAERELNEARKQAERASALKSDFLAKVSHEIRTPLNAILGFAEVIMEERFGPVGNDRYKDYLKDIHASGAHVMSLVNDLLDLSKIEAGRLELNFGAVDANKIVGECVSLMQPQANRDRVIIRLSLAQRLPNIVADERSLRQIVLNLLSNAVKFNEPGGQVIVSTALTDAGHAVIRIRDTGIGMSDAEAQTALEPFRQLATAHVSGGTGLGLPLTKALVEANRASFTIKSKKNEGTLIEVAFPPTRVLAE